MKDFKFFAWRPLVSGRHAGSNSVNMLIPCQVMGGQPTPLRTALERTAASEADVECCEGRLGYLTNMRASLLKSSCFTLNAEGASSRA